MNTEYPKRKSGPYSLRQFAFAIIAIALSISSLLAQPSSIENGEDSDLFELSPFVVSASEGYLAATSLSGSRLNRPLSETSAAISVMTSEFLEDISANSVEEAMEYSVNAVAFNQGNELEGGHFLTQIFSNSNVSVRGFNAPITRNFFDWGIYSDSYNTERIEVARGPNSILFGTGGIGGTVNVHTKRAVIGDPSAVNFSRASLQAGSWDKYRATLDVNRAIGEKAALRVNLLWHDEGHWVDFKGEEKSGIHVAGSWEFLERENVRLIVDAEAEVLSLDRVPGRLTPPQDFVNSGWDGETGVPAGGDPRDIFGLGRLPPRNQYRWIPEDNSLMNWGRTGVTGMNQQGRASLTNPLLPRNVNFEGVGSVNTDDAENFAVFLRGQFFRDIHAEIAYNDQADDFVYIDQRAYIARRDPNLTLPDGSPNPHFGELFVDSQFIQSGDRSFNSDELRATLSYNLRLDEMTDLGFLGDHWFAFLHTDNTDRFVDDTRRAYALDASGNRLGRVVMRRYYPNYGAGPLLPSAKDLGGDVARADLVNWSSNNVEEREDRVSSSQFVYMGTLWDDRVALTYGYRDDTVEVREREGREYDAAASLYSVTGPFDPWNELASESSVSYGVVFRPIDQIALFYNDAENFNADAGSVRIAPGQADPLLTKEEVPKGPVTGVTEDYGIRFYLNDSKIAGSITWFETAQTNTNPHIAEMRPGVENIMAILLQQPDYSFSPLRGVGENTSEGVEFELIANATEHLRFRATYSETLESPGSNLPVFRSYLFDEPNYVARWQSYVSGWQAGSEETLPEGVMEPSNPVVVPELGRPLTFEEAHGDAVDSNYIANSRVDHVPTGLPGVHDWVQDILASSEIMDDEGLVKQRTIPWRANLFVHYDIHDTGTIFDDFSVRYGLRARASRVLDSFFDTEGNVVTVRKGVANLFSDVGFRWKKRFENFDLKADLFIRNIFNENLIEETRLQSVPGIGGTIKYNDERNYTLTLSANF